MRKFIEAALRGQLNENVTTKEIIAYHGTRYEFDKFELFHPRGAVGNKKGVYFTKDLQTAIEYAEDVDGVLDNKSRVIKARLRIDSDSDGEIINHPYRGEEIIMFNVDKIEMLDYNVLKK